MIDFSKELDKEFQSILDNLPDPPIDKPEKINTLKRGTAKRTDYKKRFLTHHQIYPYVEYADWHGEDRESIANMTEQDLFDELGIKNKFDNYE